MSELFIQWTQFGYVIFAGVAIYILYTRKYTQSEKSRYKIKWHSTNGRQYQVKHDTDATVRKIGAKNVWNEDGTDILECHYNNSV